MHCPQFPGKVKRTNGILKLGLAKPSETLQVLWFENILIGFNDSSGVHQLLPSE